MAWIESRLLGARRVLPSVLMLIAASLIDVVATLPATAQVAYDGDDTELKQIIIFGRHGVRSAALPDATLATFAVRPFPDFGVPTGYLTVHGRQAQVLLGTYYRSYLLQQGLLSGHDAKDARSAYFRANSIQRSNVSAAALAQSLLPGAAVPVHSYPLGQPDPVFDPLAAQVVELNRNRAEAEVAGIFGQGASIASAYSAEFALIRSLLFGYPLGTTPSPSTPAGLIDATAIPIPLTVSTSNAVVGNVINAGGLATTLYAADPFIMEYANGLPLDQVAWGEISRDQLSQQTRIITKAFDVLIRPPYLNGIQSSNAAAHVLRSMQQVIEHRRIPGAFSDPNDALLVVNSSDGYVVGLAGLLNLHWQLPGYQADYCPPGGSLVLELRKSKRGHDKPKGESDYGSKRGDGYIVRAWFTSQTLEQLRDLTPLTLETPPATLRLLIPGGDHRGSNLDISFGRFQALLRAAIDQEAVQDPNIESPPGPLTGVPLN